MTGKAGSLCYEDDGKGWQPLLRGKSPAGLRRAATAWAGRQFSALLDRTLRFAFAPRCEGCRFLPADGFDRFAAVQIGRSLDSVSLECGNSFPLSIPLPSLTSKLTGIHCLHSSHRWRTMTVSGDCILAAIKALDDCESDDKSSHSKAKWRCPAWMAHQVTLANPPESVREKGLKRFRGSRAARSMVWHHADQAWPWLEGL